MASSSGATCLLLLYLSGYGQQLASSSAAHDTSQEVSCLDCSTDGQNGDASLLQQTLPTASRHSIPISSESHQSNIQKLGVSDEPPAGKQATSVLQKSEKNSRNGVSPTNAWARELVKFKENVVQRYALMECQRRVNGSSFPDQEIPSHPRDCLWQPDNAQSHVVMNIPVFYISLGGKTEEHWTHSFSTFAKDFHVVRGTMGSDRSAVEAAVNESYDNFMENEMIKKKPGLLGCAISHLTAIKDGYDTGAEMVLILESDALPDLVPWWPQSIEDYAKRLPAGWEISQLSWTSFYENLQQKFSDGRHEFFKKGPAWGAISYLIHRRAMQKVMDYVWLPEAKKFDLKRLRSACTGGFTADDCILSMTPIEKDRGPILSAENIYRATPPMFTSFHRPSDVTYLEGERYSRKPSYCTDISSILDYSNRFCSE